MGTPVGLAADVSVDIFVWYAGEIGMYLSKYVLVSVLARMWMRTL